MKIQIIKMSSVLCILSSLFITHFTACKKSSEPVQSKTLNITKPTEYICAVVTEWREPLEKACKAAGEDCTVDALSLQELDAYILGTDEAKANIWVNDLGDGQSEIVKYSSEYKMNSDMYKKVIEGKSFNMEINDTLANNHVYQLAYSKAGLKMPPMIIQQGVYPVTFIGTLGQQTYQKVSYYRYIKDGQGGYKTTVEVKMGDIK